MKVSNRKEMSFKSRATQTFIVSSHSRSSASLLVECWEEDRTRRQSGIRNMTCMVIEDNVKGQNKCLPPDHAYTVQSGALENEHAAGDLELPISNGAINDQSLVKASSYSSNSITKSSLRSYGRPSVQQLPPHLLKFQESRKNGTNRQQEFIEGSSFASAFEMYLKTGNHSDASGQDTAQSESDHGAQSNRKKRGRPPKRSSMNEKSSSTASSVIHNDWQKTAIRTYGRNDLRSKREEANNAQHEKLSKDGGGSSKVESRSVSSSKLPVSTLVDKDYYNLNSDTDELSDSEQYSRESIANVFDDSVTHSGSESQLKQIASEKDKKRSISESEWKLCTSEDETSHSTSESESQGTSSVSVIRRKTRRTLNPIEEEDQQECMTPLESQRKLSESSECDSNLNTSSDVATNINSSCDSAANMNTSSDVAIDEEEAQGEELVNEDQELEACQGRSKLSSGASDQEADSEAEAINQCKTHQPIVLVKNTRLPATCNDDNQNTKKKPKGSVS